MGHRLRLMRRGRMKPLLVVGSDVITMTKPSARNLPCSIMTSETDMSTH